MTVKELAKKLERYVKESPTLEVVIEFDGDTYGLKQTNTVLVCFHNKKAKTLSPSFFVAGVARPI